MPFRQITARVTVERKDAPGIQEAILELIDSFVVKRIPIFDSEVTSQQLHAVQDAEEVRSEAESNTQ